MPPGTPPPATPPAPAPATPPPGTPPPAFAGLPPGLLPNGFRGGKIPPASFGGNKPSPGLFDGSKAPNAAPPTLGSTSPDTSAGAPPGGFPSSSAPNSLYPPGTITPPPGGQVPENPKEKSPGANQPGIPSYGEQSFTDHLEMEAKSAAQQQASAAPPPSLPPGSSAPGSTAGEKTGSPSGLPGHTEQSPAFQAPPSTTPPVLGNDKKRKQRAGSKAEAPAVPQDGPGLGAPPVLSNPHRKPPEKTFTEKQRERKRAPRPAVPGSEFAANLPAGIAPVFDGRFSTEEYVVGPAGEIPSVLQAAAPVVSAPDRHAKPVVHADRATRVAKPAEKTPVREDTAFEVETPGGPVVAGGQEERRQSPAGPSPLDGRT
ncbi:hypothetical protein FHX45_001393 [Amycolatopsis granulosa]|nr:hypothetical protein [Amycolatopsis granulosa]